MRRRLSDRLCLPLIQFHIFFFLDPRDRLGQFGRRHIISLIQSVQKSCRHLFHTVKTLGIHTLFL